VSVVSLCMLSEFAKGRPTPMATQWSASRGEVQMEADGKKASKECGRANREFVCL